MSALDDWRPQAWSVEDEIKILLRAQRKPDRSTAACKEFAARFVASVIKRWTPGQALTAKQAQKVGAQFDRALLKTGRKVPRLEQPPYKHRSDE